MSVGIFKLVNGVLTKKKIAGKTLMDAQLNANSRNGVQNRIITGEINDIKDDISTINTHLSEKQPKTLSHAIAGQTTVEGCLSQLASQQSNAWVDITDLCSYNGGITYLHKIAKYCNGVLRVTLSMAPTNFITGAAVLSLPANFRFDEVFYCSGVCVNGSGEPVQSNAFVAENAHGAAGNTTIIVQKSNGAADYVAFTIMIPVSKLY